MNKSLLLERTTYRYTPNSSIPVEYLQLKLPYAGAIFRQDAECDILSQHLNLGPYSVWLHDIYSKDNILLRSYTPLPIFTLQFMFEDSLALPKAGYTLEERECSGFYLFPGQPQRFPMTTGKKVFSFHINIQPMQLAELSAQYPQFKELMNGIHPRVSSRINSRPYHINGICEMLIRKIMTCKYEGPGAYFFLKRCVTDIMINFSAQHLHALQPFLFSSMLHTDTCHNIFDYLANHPHKTHSLSSLSYMYNIPQYEMEHSFHQHFATSINDYMHMTKMIMLWHLIYTNTSPLQDISEISGYQSSEAMIDEVTAWYDANPLDFT